MLSRLDTIPERDGQTDGQMEYGISCVSIAVMTRNKKKMNSFALVSPHGNWGTVSLLSVGLFWTHLQRNF